MSRILFFNKLRWYARLPLKWLVFAVATVAVCYPYPSLLAKHLRHWRDPNALIDPNAASLQPLALDLRTSLPPGLSAKKTLQHVEKFVYQRVPYEWDWNTWGMADYLPTVDEVLEKGKEDCDGRAVVAASLLAGLGFKSEIVTDFAHVWVKTDKGETMGPGRRKAVVATDRGLEVHWRGLIELPRAFAYGLAVFPGEREYTLLVLGWFLLLGTQTGLAQSIIGLRILLTGFSTLRFGGADYRNPALSLQWLGVSLLVAGILVLFLRTQRQSTLSETVAPVP
jgi:hypothetical protein